MSRLKIASWNINSIRARLAIVEEDVVAGRGQGQRDDPRPQPLLGAHGGVGGGEGVALDQAGDRPHEVAPAGQGDVDVEGVARHRLPPRADADGPPDRRAQRLDVLAHLLHGGATQLVRRKRAAPALGVDRLLRILAGVDQPDTGEVVPGYGLKMGYYAQEHETLDVNRTVLENMHSAAPELTDTQARSVLGSFLFSGDDADKPASVLSGGEKTRLALAILVVSSANVLLLDEPTNNLDPASREEILGAMRTYKGAVVLVTHDEGAVEALEPERILLLPDGVEDLWGQDYLDLISLA